MEVDKRFWLKVLKRNGTAAKECIEKRLTEVTATLYHNETSFEVHTSLKFFYGLALYSNVIHLLFLYYRVLRMQLDSFQKLLVVNLLTRSLIL